MGIALVCIAVIAVIMLTYIIKSSANDKYGNRLDGIKDVEISKDKVADMEGEILKMTKVQDTTINIHGKIVNFTIDFENDATIEESQNAAKSCLEFLEENYLNYYDLQFFLTKSKEEESSSAYPILGYKKAGATNISWSKISEE